MLQACGGADLAPEPIDCVRATVDGYHFDGDAAIEGYFGRHENARHAATAEFTLKAEGRRKGDRQAIEVGHCFITAAINRPRGRAFSNLERISGAHTVPWGKVRLVPLFRQRSER